ncbi:MAG: LLM class flavin-dependent oxidoreductase [Burkholderiaceae bacterium]
MTQRAVLSILDQTPVVSGHSVADAVAATVELATLADDLGYTRFWCAEHHGLRAVANPAPEVMLARIGAATHRIRIGSGGVMLPYYSPFKLAEQFLMLEALFPNRIDLGVGRAPGGDQRTAQAVAAGEYNRGEFFPQQAEELAMLLGSQMLAPGIPAMPDDRLAHGVLLQPAVETRPQLWMLGSSDFGGALAAKLGYRFAFAQFINAAGGSGVARAYRSNFVARVGEPAPYCAVAVFAICADNDADAAALSRSVDLRRLQMALGLNTPIPTVDEAREVFESGQLGPRELAVIERERPRSIIGSPAMVAERLLALQAEFAADEIVVLTVAANYKARLRSYELLAEAFELRRPPSRA